jgi:hypothetical protein
MFQQLWLQVPDRFKAGAHYGSTLRIEKISKVAFQIHYY